MGLERAEDNQLNYRLLHLEFSARSSCEICSLLQQQAGFLCRHAYVDGQDARDLTEDESPHCVLIQHADGGAEARRACKRLRKNPRTFATPLVLISRDALDSAEEAQCFEAGANLCVSAEISAELLVLKLKSLVSLSLANQAAWNPDEKFDLLVRSVKDYAIVLLDPEGRIRDWNAGAIHLFGYTPDEAIGKESKLLFPPDELAKGRPQKEIETARATGRAGDRNWLMRKDGTSFWADGVLTALKDEHQVIRGYAKIVQDKTLEKTHQKQMETLIEELGRQKAFLENVIRLMPAGVRIAEAGSGRSLFYNDLAKQYLGPAIGTSPLNGRAPQEHLRFLDGTVLKGDELPVNRAVSSGEMVLGEKLRVQISPGDWRTLAVYAAPVRDDHGEIVAGVGLFFDVSSKKATEEELAQAIRQRDEFLSIASHELNTPLSAVLLNLELLEKRIESRQGDDIPVISVLEGLRPAIQQVHRLRKMLSELLDVSRVRNRRLNLEIDVFDLCEIVQEGIFRLEAQAKARGTEFVLRGCARTIGYWDKMRIEQVITNLLSNAIKYGEGKPVEVEVQGGEDEAELRVIDHGIGISEEDHSRIFEKFERASLRAQSESLGLGLFIAKQIVEAHGGTITVTSEQGRGSVFQVKLPLRRNRRIQSGKSD